mgnify:CR=1 FL=1
MRTDRSFHGSFTLAPLPTAWSLMRPGATDEHGSFACGKLDARKNICANLRDLWETTKRPMRLKKQMRDFAHRSHRATQMPFGLLYQKTLISLMRTDRSFHGSFTLAPLPTAWSLMRPGATDEHGSFACGKLDARKNICANLRDLWETTKRPMRLKKQMRDFAHRSHRATQKPFGVIYQKNTRLGEAPPTVSNDDRMETPSVF